MQIPTVKVKDAKDSYYIINESDFDKEKHQLFVEPKKKKAKAEKE